MSVSLGYDEYARNNKIVPASTRRGAGAVEEATDGLQEAVDRARRKDDSKPTNPKDAIGIMKLPLHLVSPIVKAYAAIAHFLGNVKYGAWNWRAGGARVSVYVSALHRHVDKYWEGEWYDKADGTPHLANALACINILIETHHHKNIVDDRPARGTDLDPLYAELETIMVKIKTKYADKSPHHHTKDNE